MAQQIATQTSRMTTIQPSIPRLQHKYGDQCLSGDKVAVKSSTQKLHVPVALYSEHAKQGSLVSGQIHMLRRCYQSVASSQLKESVARGTAAQLATARAMQALTVHGCTVCTTMLNLQYSVQQQATVIEINVVSMLIRMAQVETAVLTGSQTTSQLPGRLELAVEMSGYTVSEGCILGSQSGHTPSKRLG